MKTTNDDLFFDDDEAVKFIIKNLPAQFKTSITAESITYVLDVMYDFYDENGFVDEDSVEEANINEEDMFNYISQIIKEEKIVKLSDEELQAILDGEFEYGKSIDIYKES